MRGHLGSRVSALLDGQLDPVEEERAWAHVHACHLCRDLVEREGWVKTRLAGGAAPEAPAGLRGSLLRPASAPYAAPFPTGALAAGPSAHPGVRGARLRGALLGGGAVGVAVAGVLALGVAPGDLPRRPAPADLSQVTPGPSPVRGPVGPLGSAGTGRPGEPPLRTSVGSR